MTPEVANQVPLVFCGPTADAAFFAAMALAVFGVYSVARMLRDRATRLPRDDEPRIGL